MGTYSVEQAIELWRVGKLTAEQAIGQLLQFVRDDRKRMSETERRVARVDFVVSAQSNERREPAPQMRPALNTAKSAARDAPDE
jgi:hypothetical protein